MFRVEVEATGAHGCDREMPDGSKVFGCGRMGCPDCIAREFVAELQRRGVSVSTARIVHWPGQLGQVVDNLLTRERTGAFPPTR